jgi:hypothetical protein
MTAKRGETVPIMYYLCYILLSARQTQGQQENRVTNCSKTKFKTVVLFLNVILSLAVCVSNYHGLSVLKNTCNYYRI